MALHCSSFSRLLRSVGSLRLLLVALLLVASAQPGLAQLRGRVGPTTSTASKRSAKVCSVLDYGGKASRTADIGPALVAAFAACKAGGTIYVPPGEYGMATWASLSGGQGWALQLDGVIYRTGTDGGHMIFIEKATDVEIYSSTSMGAVQGNGFEYHKGGYEDRETGRRRKDAR